MLINDPNLELVAKGFQTVYNEAFDATVTHKDTIAMVVGSTAAEENYGWLGQFPALREWIGDRHVKELSSHGFKISNRKFESTVRVKADDIADDRYGVYKPMFSEMGRVARQHPDTMIFELLAKGFETDCYDGQNFFDSDHAGDKNKLDGTATSVSNMQQGKGSPWFLLDLSKAVKPIIWQEREKYQFKSLNNPNDTHVFMRDEFIYGIKARVNCGFGLWQLAFGSRAELNAANYAAARKAMMNFAGDQGQLLGIMPTHLVVPGNLESDARSLLKADQTGGTTNIWKDSADLIITPFLR
ncbi:Mu-like prophage major head subunit gpT family protein [Rhizobium sp. CFBP 8762]|uniref:Mu-like prophage major head subunit gpT family protein n=1 Tax=Rhizobium sp. CFBP 8762 TaxID=2775279 RepID=UPI00177F6C48|nr:Mu-like prophage major head subunit gpT family protein [Rhizobium sp. CFBP 8762]MBD8556350.1 Mu-like prophage major head subunit gpT family protein [Rhizobium sp. CFBP 8762]